eukprot:gene13262-18833_t
MPGVCGGAGACVRPCPACTFHNADPAAVACAVCGGELPPHSRRRCAGDASPAPARPRAADEPKGA